MMATENKNGLPIGWIRTTLEECVDILDSQRMPINADEREGRIAGKSQKELHPYYGATGQVGWIDDYLFDEELVLLGEDGAPFLEPSRNKAYVVRSKSWVNNHAHVLRAISGLTLNPIVCHYLNSFDFHGFVTGTTRLKLPQAPMKKIPFPLPPLAEQQRIVSKIEELLTRLDAGVKALNAIKAQLKRYRQSVLKSAFEGKLTAEWREAQKGKLEPASVLLLRIREERKKKLGSKYKEPPPVDDSELPELPEGWAWASTGQLFWFVTSGSRGWARYYSESGALFLRIGNLNHDSIDLDLQDIQMVSPPKGTEGERTRVSEGDILISITADVGMIAVVPKDFSEAYINQHIALARLVGCVNATYIAWFLASRENGLKKFRAMQRGATKVGLGLDDIRSVYIPIPSVAEQDTIVSELERSFSVADAIERSINQSLAQSERLRKSILKRAFEGKLVPQDPNDPPASELLERIRSERENATKKSAKRNDTSTARAGELATKWQERTGERKNKSQILGLRARKR